MENSVSNKNKQNRVIAADFFFSLALIDLFK
jgi:hypothetical protein